MADGDDDDDEEQVERGRGRTEEVGMTAELGLGISSGDCAAQSCCWTLGLRAMVMS